MISQEAVDAYNSRLTIDTSNVGKLTPSQRDAIKMYGSQAEALLKNKDLAFFIHQFKFEVADSLTAINGHSPDDNSRRIALTNQLSGIEEFIKSLQRAVYMKNRVVTLQQEPAPLTEEDLTNVRRTYHA